MNYFFGSTYRAWYCVFVMMSITTSEAKKHVLAVPAECVQIVRFDKPCVNKGREFICNGVHMMVKPTPACQQYDGYDFVHVPMPKDVAR